MRRPRYKSLIAGLSNETVVIDHPTAKDETGKPAKVYLRKTLELSYKLGGDALSGPRPSRFMKVNAGL